MGAVDNRVPEPWDDDTEHRANYQTHAWYAQWWRYSV